VTGNVIVMCTSASFFVCFSAIFTILLIRQSSEMSKIVKIAEKHTKKDAEVHMTMTLPVTCVCDIYKKYNVQYHTMSL
jgi:hypothetical protein